MTAGQAKRTTDRHGAGFAKDQTGLFVRLREKNPVVEGFLSNLSQVSFFGDLPPPPPSARESNGAVKFDEAKKREEGRAHAFRPPPLPFAVREVRVFSPLPPLFLGHGKQDR